MKIKIIPLLVLLTLILIVMAGCSNNEETNNDSSTTQATTQTNEDEVTEANGAEMLYPITITDSLGREITIEQEPQTVISTGPNLTEVIFAIGAGNKLIGRSSYCNYPESAVTVEEIGDISSINIEKIVEMNPDLVFATSFIHPDIISNLESQGVTVLPLYKQESIEGAYELITDFGKVLNKSSEAEAIIADMQERISDITKKVEGLTKPNVYYVAGYGEYGDFTATGDTFISQLIELAGGNNAAKDGTDWMYSYEKLVENNPDIIILSNLYDTKTSFITADGYKDLKAVQEGQVYEVNEDALTRQGPRIADALEELVNIFHP